MESLYELEQKSIYIIREAYANFKDLCMLWSVGKDSTVLLHLARKAFLGHVPFPLIHIDTSYKIPEMIKYRDKLTRKWKLNMIYGINSEAIAKKETFPEGRLTRSECCQKLKTETLRNILSGKWPRYRYDHKLRKYVVSRDRRPFTGVIVGIRADEEGTRSKERYFSAREKNNYWNIAGQEPEFWEQFKTDFPPGTHIRIHPLLDWTEPDIWEYIKKEEIPTVSLYYDKGTGKRYRSLGCEPCTKPISSKAKDIDGIIRELKSGKLRNIAERSGREQDKECGGTLEKLRAKGYM